MDGRGIHEARPPPPAAEEPPEVDGVWRRGSHSFSDEVVATNRLPMLQWRALRTHVGITSWIQWDILQFEGERT